MTTAADRAVRFSQWWVNAYTSTAPEPARTERRAEIESDVFEHLSCAVPPDEARVARSVIGRTVRGVPDDLAWRLGVEGAHGRLEWHLAHPTTILGVSLVIDAALETVWDASVHRLPLITPLAQLIHPTLLLLWAVTLACALVAAARWRPRFDGRPQLSVQAWRSASIATMSIAFALAGFCRFAPSVWGQISAAAWAGFNVALFVFAATWFSRPARAARILLDFRKVSS